MNPEDLHLTFVGLRLRHPPRPRSAETIPLQQLFAIICKRHKFESFESPEGGGFAIFRTEGIRELSIERDGLSIEEDVTVDFELLKRNFVDQVETVKEELKIPVFFEPRIKLRALWPIPDGEASVTDVLRERVMRLNADQFALLGESLESVGLTVQVDIEEFSHMFLELSPYVRDPSQLHIDIENYRHQTIETPEVIEALLSEVYDYFDRKVRAFAQTFMP